MKKFALVLAMASLLVFPLAGCGKKTLKVGATAAPHAEILESIKDEMANRGVEMEIVEFTDYPLINQALNNGDIDANYFQHAPYLDNFNKENGTHIVSVSAIHVEPMGIYSESHTTLDDIKK